jgi:hypothetical protein
MFENLKKAEAKKSQEKIDKKNPVEEQEKENSEE